MIYLILFLVIFILYKLYKDDIIESYYFYIHNKEQIQLITTAEYYDKRYNILCLFKDNTDSFIFKITCLLLINKLKKHWKTLNQK